ncbi:hypothetical protein AOLI_G00046160 [Acnodon oligacanthus]
MEKAVGEMNLLQVLVYLDDLIVFGRSLEEHEERLLKVLDRLEEAGLKISLDKCQFCQPKLSNSEQNYPIHQLEFLSLKRAVVDKFHNYLYGATFTVRTDNNPLTYVLTSAKLNATGQRWLAALSTYDFSIKYRPGKHKIDADLLSRNMSETKKIGASPDGIPDVYAFPTHLELSPLEQLSKEELIKAQREDAVIGMAFQALNKGNWPEEKKLQWSQHVGHLVHAYNSTRCDAMGDSPYYLMFGREAQLPVDLCFGTMHYDGGDMTHSQYISKLKEDLKRAYRLASEAADKNNERNKRLYDKRVRFQALGIGDRVLLQNLGLKGKHMLENRWSAVPYKIVEKLRPEGDKRGLKTVHRDHLLPIGLSVRLPRPETKEESLVPDVIAAAKRILTSEGLRAKMADVCELRGDGCGSDPWQLILAVEQPSTVDNFSSKLQGLMKSEGKTMEDIQALFNTPQSQSASPESIIHAVGELLDKTMKPAETGGYRQLQTFSDVLPTPVGEEQFESWLEQASVMVEESDCSKKEKKRRIFESLKGPALEVIRAVRTSESEASPEKYLEALENAFGTAESGDDLSFALRLMWQQADE